MNKIESLVDLIFLKDVRIKELETAFDEQFKHTQNAKYQRDVAIGQVNRFANDITHLNSQLEDQQKSLAAALDVAVNTRARETNLAQECDRLRKSVDAQKAAWHNLNGSYDSCRKQLASAEDDKARFQNLANAIARDRDNALESLEKCRGELRAAEAFIQTIEAQKQAPDRDSAGDPTVYKFYKVTNQPSNGVITDWLFRTSSYIGVEIFTSLYRWETAPWHTGIESLRDIYRNQLVQIFPYEAQQIIDSRPKKV